MALNIGIITPDIIVNTIIDFYQNNNINIESIEGFTSQIIGWREHVKAVYEFNELDVKNSNFFNLNKTLPDLFYTGGKPRLDQLMHLLKELTEMLILITFRG